MKSIWDRLNELDEAARREISELEEAHSSVSRKFDKINAEIAEIRDQSNDTDTEIESVCIALQNIDLDSMEKDDAAQVIKQAISDLEKIRTGLY